MFSYIYLLTFAFFGLFFKIVGLCRVRPAPRDRSTHGIDLSRDPFQGFYASTGELTITWAILQSRPRASGIFKSKIFQTTKKLNFSPSRQLPILDPMRLSAAAPSRALRSAS